MNPVPVKSERKKLFAYRFSFKGLALGGEAIVIARTPEEATECMNERGTPTGDFATLYDEKPVEVTCPMIVHYDNGDY